MRFTALLPRVATMFFAVLAWASVADAAQIEGCPPVTAQYGAAEERDFVVDTPDGAIRGTVAAPDGAPPRALSLMLHGYTGSRNEIPVAGGEGMFARTARAFAARGIATLRIDFIGSGRSDGSWADTRFSTQARDAIRAASAFASEYGERALPLGVLGYSQGGLVALRAAAEGAPFDSIALWNPVMDPMATYGVIFGRDTIRDAAQAHAAGETAPLFRDTRLRPGFFAELVEADPIGDAARATAPVLIVTGRRDPLVTDGAALAARVRAGRMAETVLVDLDAGHNLGAIGDPALLDDVIACTAGFLLNAATQ